MKPEQFCYWLQGKFERGDGSLPVFSEEDIKMINDHLQLVFKKETPQTGGTTGFNPNDVACSVRPNEKYCGSTFIC